MSILGNSVGGILPTPQQIGAATPADVQKFARKNLLDNWYFGNPVNQRGLSEYTGHGYAIDRWVAYGSTVVTLEDGGLKLTKQNSVAMFVQHIESPIWEALAGKEVTLSVLTSHGLHYHTLTLPSDTSTLWDTSNIFGDNLVIDIYGIPASSDARCGVRCLSDAPSGTSWIIYAIKLELGSVQTLAHQENGVWVLNEIPNYAEELAKCQRYALFGRIRGVPTNRWGSAVGFAFHTPVTMREEGGAPSIVGTFVVNCTDSPDVHPNFTVHNTLATNNDIYVYGLFDSSEDAAKATAMNFEPGNGFSMDL